MKSIERLAEQLKAWSKEEKAGLMLLVGADSHDQSLADEIAEELEGNTETLTTAEGIKVESGPIGPIHPISEELTNGYSPDNHTDELTENTPAPFKPGDVVRLKGNYIHLTVSHSDEVETEVHYYVQNVGLQIDVLPNEVLTKSESE